MSTCPQCGGNVQDGAKFCPECSHKMCIRDRLQDGPEYVMLMGYDTSKEDEKETFLFSNAGFVKQECLFLIFLGGIITHQHQDVYKRQVYSIP